MDSAAHGYGWIFPYGINFTGSLFQKDQWQNQRGVGSGLCLENLICFNLYVYIQRNPDYFLGLEKASFYIFFFVKLTNNCFNDFF